MKNLLVLIFLILGNVILSQEVAFKTYSVREGLAQSQVYSIDQDQRGYLWIATQGGGVCKFDGSEFNNITINDGLNSNTVNCVKVFGDQIFFGTSQGVSIFKDDKIQESISTNEPINWVQIIDSAIYAIGNNQIFKLNHDKSAFEIITPSNLEKHRIESVFEFEKELWVASTNGLFNVFNQSKKINGLKAIGTDHFTSACFKDNILLIGTYGKGLVALKRGDAAVKIVKDTLELFQDRIITTIFEDSKGGYWIGTQRKGVYRYDVKEKKWEQFGETEGLSNDHVKCIYEDVWGQIWIGTSGGGVNRYSGSQFMHYTENSGLNGNYIFSVLNSTKNELWLGTSGNGVMRINDTSKVVYNEKNGFFDVKVKSLFEDSRGLIWIGSEGKGVSVHFQRDLIKSDKDIPVLPLDTILNYADRKRFPSTLWVKVFAENKKGEVFMATSGGGLVKAKIQLDTFPRISFRKIKISGSNQLSLRINDMFFNEKDDLILATNDKGIGILSEGILTYYNSSNSNIPDKITSVDSDEENRIWFGSDQGVGFLIGDSVYNFDVSKGLASNNIYQIQQGNDGYLWIGSEKGLDRIKLIDNQKLEIKHFGSDEGFTGIETSLNASFKDKGQNLWFGTVNGLSVYRPRDVEQSDRPPVIYFKSIKLFYESLEKERADLDFSENSLSFSFGAVYLPNPRHVQYQWRLEGFDSEWSEATSSSSITYSNLRPGNYIFWVRAGVGNNWSDPIKFEFTIAKPYWEEFWFLASVWGGGIFILVLIVFIIVFRIRQRNKEVNRQLELEKSLIELEQKALRLQMNPHFIFNSLNTIQHLIIEKDEKSAKYYLSKFAKLMRQILENSREKLISIEDEVKTLENYLIIEKFSRQDFEYEINIDDSINTEEEILPPMMIQPFVENAIIHGLKGLKNRKGIIKISFKLKDNYLQFEVEDNGQGRENAENQKSQIANYHRSTALKVTQERLDNLNKGSKFKSFEIIDLKDSKGGAIGTKVILRVKS